MAGDEIVAEWLGDVYSHRYSLSTSTVTRFSANSLRYRTVHIYNFDAAQNAMIGQYNSNITTFGNNAITLASGNSIKLNFVDLYKLAHLAPGGALYLHLLEINKY